MSGAQLHSGICPAEGGLISSGRWPPRAIGPILGGAGSVSAS